MRLVFAGTPAFARSALQALLDAGHDIALVLTQPDRPAGRGLKVRPSEVKALALERGLPLHQPPTLRTDAALAPLRATAAQAMVVAAYGLILPPSVLDLYALGCINIHASLLPRWRGAAPIQRALLAGDAETGISIMRMEAGLDTGPVYLARALPISGRDTAQTLHDKLAELGGQCIVQALPAIAAGTLAATPQPEAGVTYAHKLAKEEAELDWGRSAVELDRQVRAFVPFPVATTRWRGEVLRVWAAHPLEPLSGDPGTVLNITEDGIVVGCGAGALCLQSLQRAGGKRLSAREFVLGARLAVGDRLGPAA
ncbi:MAG TPA: methionyl-tRNA formyltransferase [Burkholderiales bacterium]|nr:methionyl-tRNA formyltransferase [Burkholderiales bacterium]